MLNVGTPELLVVLFVALVVLGPTKLPEAARQVGRAVAELRRLSAGFQAELRDAMREPEPPREPAPPADAGEATPTLHQPTTGFPGHPPDGDGDHEPTA